MAFQKIILFSVLSLATVNAWSQVTRSCEFIHTPLSYEAKAYYKLMAGDTTTGVRGESKRVLKTVDLEAEILKLEALGFKRRDAVLPGTTNITRTDYMPVRTFFMDGKKLAEKNRFRKYLIKRGDEMVPAEGYADRSWFENKIDHPNYPGRAVFKPRALILDSDIPLISNRESFFKYREEIESRILSINNTDAKTIGEIKDMMHAMEMRFRSSDPSMDGMFVRTEYERASYSMAIKSNSNPDVKMDIQVTHDKDVLVTDLRTGKVYRPYRADESVLEWKTPIKYINYTASDITDAPGLATFQPFITFANEKHLKNDYVADKGKMSQLKRFTSMPKQIFEVVADTD